MDERLFRKYQILKENMNPRLDAMDELMVRIAFLNADWRSEIFLKIYPHHIT